MMNHVSIYGILFLMTLSSMARAGSQDPTIVDKLSNNGWYSGSANCTTSKPPLEVFSVTPTSLILRQNKCLHYEAPFMYLLIGHEKALLIDTGATSNPTEFNLAERVTNILTQVTADKAFPLIVIHTHGHSDHIAADHQFAGKAHIQMIASDLPNLTQHYFGHHWPLTNDAIELGNRRIVLIPTPGHKDDAIAFYDPKTRLLFSGDTFYPGRLYVRDWMAYRKSIERLTNFASENDVVGLLGAHIEVDKDGKEFKTGARFQPNEANLVLYQDDLIWLQSKLQQFDQPTHSISHKKFRVVPISN